MNATISPTKLKIISPVTQKANVSLITTLSSDQIVECYRKTNGVNVARFFENTPIVSIYKCEDSGYRFFYPSNIFGDEKFYIELLERTKGAYYPHTKWEHSFAARQINKGDKVLEIASGDGFFLDLLAKKGIQGTGLELSEGAIALGQAKGLDLRKEFIQDHAAGHEGEYDVVCCFQILEHIYDVQDFLNACLKALKKNGKLIIAVPNSDPYLYRHELWHAMNMPPHHSGLWDKNTFAQLSRFFPVTPEHIIVEPLSHAIAEVKPWYLAQKEHYLQTSPLLGKLMGLVPRPLYKLATKIFSPFIPGRNIVAVFRRL